MTVRGEPGPRPLAAPESREVLTQRQGGRLQPSLYCLILLRIVRLLIPRSSAALVRLPFHFSSARTMVSRSMSFIDTVAVDPSDVPAAVACREPAEA